MQDTNLLFDKPGPKTERATVLGREAGGPGRGHFGSRQYDHPHFPKVRLEIGRKGFAYDLKLCNDSLIKFIKCKSGNCFKISIEDLYHQ